MRLSDRELYRVAYLSRQERLTEKEIAGRCGRTHPSFASRALQRAAEAGLFAGGFSPPRQIALEFALEKQHGLREAVVVPLPCSNLTQVYELEASAGEPNALFDDVLKQTLAMGAAMVLEEVVDQKTRALKDEIGKRDAGAGEKAEALERETVCLGLAGSSTLSLMTRHLRRRSVPNLSLVSIDAAIMSGLLLDSAAGIMAAIHTLFQLDHPGEVYTEASSAKQRREVGAKLDIAFCSIGVPDEQVSSLMETMETLKGRLAPELNSQGRRKLLTTVRKAACDVRYRLLCEDGTNLEYSVRDTRGATHKSYLERFSILSADELRMQGKEEHKWFYCVAGGRRKVKGLRAALRSGCISRLITDEWTAAQLADLDQPVGASEPASDATSPETALHHALRHALMEARGAIAELEELKMELKARERASRQLTEEETKRREAINGYLDEARSVLKDSLRLLDEDQTG